MCPPHPTGWLVWQLSAWHRLGWCGNSLTSSWKSGGSTARTRPQRRRRSAQRASLTKGSLQGVSLLPNRHTTMLCFSLCLTHFMFSYYLAILLIVERVYLKSLSSGMFPFTCLVRRRCQWGCEVWRENITTGKKSQSFIEMEELERKLSDGVLTMWYYVFTQLQILSTALQKKV